jgi:metallo-beta-lactamase class B
VNVIRRLAGFVLLVLSLAAPVLAQGSPAWTTPFPPFRIAGNLYYVGSKDLAAYLIATPKGLILINANLQSSPPLIEKSIAAQILKLTGAKYEVMAPDVPVVESGGRDDFQYGADPSMHFPPAHVDRVLHDGDTVSLGGTTLTAHLTPGHTKGTTTWTLAEPFDGRVMHVVIVGSPNVNPGYRLVGNRTYPRIASDYEHGFEVLRGLPCDIFLGAHGGYFGLVEKYARWKAGDKNAFVDPAGYRAFIADSERAFEANLHRQQGRRR